ncbi:MAG: type II toxin-antitoxin system HicA family toxin [Desulfotomaculum sp.]|nr:type II toxin-antitoxin system HicA family toxin [Desulfotomaculum sp.]
MNRLPVISGKQLCKIFKKLSYDLDHQTGSHIILRCTKYPYRRLVVPNHKEVAKGTLRTIIRQAGLTIDEFKKILY